MESGQSASWEANSLSGGGGLPRCGWRCASESLHLDWTTDGLRKDLRQLDHQPFTEALRLASDGDTLVGFPPASVGAFMRSGSRTSQSRKCGLWSSDWVPGRRKTGK